MITESKLRILTNNPRSDRDRDESTYIYNHHLIMSVLTIQLLRNVKQSKTCVLSQLVLIRIKSLFIFIRTSMKQIGKLNVHSKNMNVCTYTILTQCFKREYLSKNIVIDTIAKVFHKKKGTQIPCYVIVIQTAISIYMFLIHFTRTTLGISISL